MFSKMDTKMDSFGYKEPNKKYIFYKTQYIYKYKNVTIILAWGI